MRYATLLLFVLMLSITVQAQRAGVKPKPAQKAASTFSLVLRTEADRKKLESFLFANERRVVSLDVFLTTEDIQGAYSVGEKQIYIDLSRKDKDGNSEGSEWIIDLKDGENDLILNEKTGRLQAYVKVISIEGPQMGIMSIYSKPVPIEKAR